MNILVLNGGSSSLKAVLRSVPDGTLPDDPPAPLWQADVDWGRHPGHASIRIRRGTNPPEESEVAIQSPGDVLGLVIESIWSGPSPVVAGPAAIQVVGHRVVHGGKAFRETTRITAEVRAGIRKFCEFAPEHNRLELEAIEIAEKIFGPDVPEVAMFDTAFHATLPLEAQVYAGPYDWFEKGIRRYGFHGISHQYAWQRSVKILGGDPAQRRLVSCHLGNGASLAAVLGGKSLDTTMGFTPLEGLMMGTRSGSIDPGILIYLVRHLNFRADDLDRMLNKESGLKGVSGISGDMREILAAIGRGEERPRLAYDIYLHRLCSEIGAMAASLGGIDVLLFTAGIGENCPPLRQEVCRRLAFLGLRIDAAKNANPQMDSDISDPESRVRILVVHADEDWQVARECHRFMPRSLPI